ncbi:hypothetical protein CJU89_6613 [Yarrowia sp. B02]|nr:hypothetical protein CJU89_6613 [Yarrowia sp. B02]
MLQYLVAPKKMTDKPIGGKRTPCTPEAFNASIDGKIRGKCDLEGVGTFYFVYGEVSATDPLKRHEVYLCYYDRERQTKHTSYRYVFVASQMSRGLAADIVIDQNTFLIYCGRNGAFVLKMNDTWTAQTVDIKISAAALRRIVEAYTPVPPPEPVQQSALSKVRHATEGDFGLVSEDGEVVKVHRPVMEALWPFFKSMVDSGMREVGDNAVTLCAPKTTLEVIVQHLYDEPLELDFEDAARLVVFAQMYDFPKLLEVSLAKVKAEVLDMGKAVFLWQNAFEAKNADIQEHAAGNIAKLMSTGPSLNEIDGLEKLELVALFKDISLSLNEGEER